VAVSRTHLRNSRAMVAVVIVAQNIRCEEGPLQVHRFDHIAGEGARCNTHLRFAAGQRVRVAMGLTARHLCGTFVFSSALGQDVKLRPRQAEFCHMIAADVFWPHAFASIDVLRRGRKLSSLPSHYDLFEVAIHVHRNLHPGCVILCSDSQSRDPIRHLPTLLQLVIRS